MTQEEKAKAYDEAVKQIKECTPDENGFITIYPQDIFPKLKESEDEKVRKHLISLFEKFVTLGVANECETSEIKVDDILFWLEKQAKKPAWSEEDDRMRKAIIDNIKAICEEGYFVGNIGSDKLIDWLKSIRPQSYWKPSVEQLEALHTMNVTGCITEVGQGKSLVELYKQLNELREE